MNTIRIKVTSEDKTQSKEYVIKVTRTKNLEQANTNLEVLAIEDAFLNPAFDNTITQYTTEVSNAITNLNMIAVPENEKATVTITGSTDLKEGNNKVTISVIAANGITKRNYIVNVYKRNIEEEKQYQKEQEEQQEKLEEAYQIEKLSTDSQKQEEDNQKVSTNNTKLTIGIISIVLVISGIVIGGVYYYRKKK